MAGSSYHGPASVEWEVFGQVRDHEVECHAELEPGASSGEHPGWHGDLIDRVGVLPTLASHVPRMTLRTPHGVGEIRFVTRPVQFQTAETRITMHFIGFGEAPF